MVILTEPTQVLIPCRQTIQGLELKQIGASAECTVYLSLQKDDTFKTPTNEAPELLVSVASKAKFNFAAKSFKAVWTSDDSQHAFFGCGKKTSVEAFYAHGQNLSAALYADNPRSVSLHFVGPLAEQLTPDMLLAFLHRFMYGLVKSQVYKSLNKDDLRKLEFISCQCFGIESTEVKRLFVEAKILAVNSVLSSAWIDAPPNYLNPQTYVNSVREEVSKRSNLTLRILDETECAERKMGAFLGVAQGSRHGAFVVHLTYKHGEPRKKLAFVGKGITMDTGGYSLKSPAGMLTMKCDMGGSSAVLAAGLACADLKLENVEAHFIGMICENMVDKDAYRPGDIVTASNGLTIEVQNTDAEGRLALADGLIYAEKVLGGPGKGTIVDVATLTGAILVALGTEIAAVFSNDDQTRADVLKR